MPKFFFTFAVNFIQDEINSQNSSLSNEHGRIMHLSELNFIT